MSLSDKIKLVREKIGFILNLEYYAISLVNVKRAIKEIENEIIMKMPDKRMNLIKLKEIVGEKLLTKTREKAKVEK